MYKIIKIIFIGLVIFGSVLFLKKGFKRSYTINEIYETRSEIIFNNSSIEVDNILLPYVKEFIEEALRYNVNVDSFSRDIMGVYYDYTPIGLIGIVVKKTNTTDAYVLISPLLGMFINKLRLDVFHELGHYYLNRKHCHKFCGEIMSSPLNIFSIYNNWENQKKVMFENLSHKSLKN